MSNNSKPTHSIEEMQQINKLQAEFYETAHERRGNSITKLWSSLRNSVSAIRREIGVGQYVNDLHWQWLGDLSDKKVNNTMSRSK